MRRATRWPPAPPRPLALQIDLLSTDGDELLAEAAVRLNEGAQVALRSVALTRRTEDAAPDDEDLHLRFDYEITEPEPALPAPPPGAESPA